AGRGPGAYRLRGPLPLRFLRAGRGLVDLLALRRHGCFSFREKGLRCEQASVTSTRPPPQGKSGKILSLFPGSRGSAAVIPRALCVIREIEGTALAPRNRVRGSPCRSSCAR